MNAILNMNDGHEKILVYYLYVSKLILPATIVELFCGKLDEMKFERGIERLADGASSRRDLETPVETRGGINS